MALDTHLEQRSRFEETARLVNKHSGRRLARHRASGPYLWTSRGYGAADGGCCEIRRRHRRGCHGVVGFDLERAGLRHVQPLPPYSASMATRSSPPAGGGMILTNDDDHARHARHFTSTAKKSHAWSFDHDEIAYNYRLPNINPAAWLRPDGAAFGDGRSQTGTRGTLIWKCSRQFAQCQHLSTANRKRARSNYWLNTLVIDREFAPERDRLLSALHANGVHARPLWTPMHMLPMYQDLPAFVRLPVAEDMNTRTVSICPAVRSSPPASRSSANKN